MTNINCLASAVQNALTSWQITSQLSASVRGDLGNVSRVSYFSNDRQALRTRTRTHALNTDWLSDAFTDLMTGQLTESTPLVICHSFFSWGMLEVFKDCPEDFFCYYKIFYNERDVWFISSQSERSGDRVRVSVHPEFWCSLFAVELVSAECYRVLQNASTIAFYNFDFDFPEDVYELSRKLSWVLCCWRGTWRYEANLEIIISLFYFCEFWLLFLFRSPNGFLLGAFWARLCHFWTQ